MLLHLSINQRSKIVKSSDIYFLMNSILIKMQKVDRMKEHLWVIGLKRNHEVNYVQWVVIIGSRYGHFL